jgi:hypothetical protein
LKLGNKDEGAADCGSLTLRRLMVWLDQPIDRLRYLNIVCEAVKGGIENYACQLEYIKLN